MSRVCRVLAYMTAVLVWGVVFGVAAVFYGIGAMLERGGRR